MIGYTTVGTIDLSRSSKFYDTLLSVLGGERTIEATDYVAWGKPGGASMFSIHIPHDGNPATVGNGVMIALRADSRSTVDAAYRRAIEIGAADEGEPGERTEGFYAAYFRDLDGNKINVHYVGK